MCARVDGAVRAIRTVAATVLGEHRTRRGQRRSLRGRLRRPQRGVHLPDRRRLEMSSRREVGELPVGARTVNVLKLSCASFSVLSRQTLDMRGVPG